MKNEFDYDRLYADIYFSKELPSSHRLADSMGAVMRLKAAIRRAGGEEDSLSVDNLDESKDEKETTNKGRQKKLK